MNINVLERKAHIGQVGVFGQQGAGKSRIIQSLCQHYGKSSKVAWNEEKEMMGTTGVLPFVLPLPKGKITVMDNPGQDNLDLIRSIVAQSGAGYRGLIIVVDDSSRIFAPVSKAHADAISPFVRVTEDQKIPVAIISNKSDLSNTLRLKGIIRELSEIIEERLVHFLQQKRPEISYYNRLYGKWEKRKVEISQHEGINFLKYVEFEQILVSILDWSIPDLLLFHEDKVEMTKMNIRLLARAFTMGVYSLLLKSKYVETDVFAFRGISPSLYTCLNHHRPSFLETNIAWGDILDTPEPFMPLDIFTALNIRAIFMGKILGTDEMHMDFVKHCENNSRWNVVTHARTNVFEENRNKLGQILEKLSQSILDNEAERGTVETFDLDGF